MDSEAVEENDSCSDSSDGEEIIDVPRAFNMQLASLFENNNLSLQDIMNYLSREKLTKEGSLVLPEASIPIEDPNLCIK